jgi:hypothetical protein
LLPVSGTVFEWKKQQQRDRGRTGRVRRQRHRDRKVAGVFPKWYP